MKTLNFLNGKHIQSLRIEENRLIIFCAHGEYFRVFCENNNKITDKIQLRAEVSDDLLTLNSLISSKVLGVELFSAFNKIQFEIVTEHHRLFVYWLDYKQSEPLKLRIEKLVVGTYERLKIE